MRRKFVFAEESVIKVADRRKNVAKHDLFSLKTSSQASSIHEGVQFAPLVTHKASSGLT